MMYSRLLPSLLVLLWNPTDSEAYVPSFSATRRTDTNAVSKQEDLEKTIQVILGNIKKQQQVNASSMRQQEAAQRALLQAHLTLERQQARQRLAVQAAQKARKVEATQRALLAAQLGMSKQRPSSSTTTSTSTSLSTTVSVVDPTLAEARQRALLIAQLKMKQQNTATTLTTTTMPLTMDDDDDAFWNKYKATLQADYKDALIRIACARAPSKAVRPHHVQQVSLLSLTAERMEIAIVIAEPDGTCVSVAVPVDWPLPWNNYSAATTNDNDSLQACLVHNVQQLDRSAYDHIAHLERQEDNAQQLQDDWHVKRILQQAPASYNFGGDLPTWWKVGDVEIQRECDALKPILNSDDFCDELRALAVQALPDAPQDWIQSRVSCLHVTTAAVALVGAAGLYLRAQVRDQSAGGNQNQLSIIALAIPFFQETTKPCLTADQVRESVLRLIEGATVSG